MLNFTLDILSMSRIPDGLPESLFAHPRAHSPALRSHAKLLLNDPLV